jgi:heme/copper-type cytochrome/quinol oxidase subunit 3
VSTRAVDVSGLPPVAQGPRVTVWWGVLGLIAIEATVLGLLVAAYFYLRQNFATWPPVGTAPPDLGWGTANVLVLVASVVPMYLTDRLARGEQRRPVLIGLAITTVLSLASFGLRVLEFGAMHCRWDTHAYGSIVWTILGMHAGHLVASNVENLALLLLFLRGPMQRKHFTDANVNALYWYFVAFAWVPLYVIIYVGARL